MNEQKKLIFSAYANIDNANTSVNINQKSKRCDVYYKNIVVALVSAKINNPECDVAFVTNQEVPLEYKKHLDLHHILIVVCPFNSFRFKNEYSWNLAFYKLCAYQKVLSFDYDNYLMIDSDVFVQNNISMLWNWTPDYLIILDTEETTQRWQNEMHAYTGNHIFITHWGGEFIAGSKAILIQFIKTCDEIFNDMLERGFETIHGDEFIESIAIYKTKIPVKHAGLFVFRFWTRTDYRVKSVLYKGGISVLHVPSEKEYGMLKLYRFINNHKTIPSQHKAQMMLHIRRPSFSVFIKRILLNMKQAMMKNE